MKYLTILADPPWPQPMLGRYTLPKSTGSGNHKAPRRLPYQSLSVNDIAALPVGDLATESCHLWLWTTNTFLRDGFDVMAAWGFRYLSPVHWIKPSGMGNYFVSRSQTLLFGYRGKLRMLARYRPNLLFAPSRRHSRKPECSYDLIESVSPGPRLELFARERRLGWDTWGDEVHCDVSLALAGPLPPPE